MRRVSLLLLKLQNMQVTVYTQITTDFWLDYVCRVFVINNNWVSKPWYTQKCWCPAARHIIWANHCYNWCGHLELSFRFVLQITPRQLASMVFIQCAFLMYYFQANNQYPSFFLTSFTQCKFTLELVQYVHICICRNIPPPLPFWQLSHRSLQNGSLAEICGMCQVVSWASPTGGFQSDMKDSCQVRENRANKSVWTWVLNCWGGRPGVLTCLNGPSRASWWWVIKTNYDKPNYGFKTAFKEVRIWIVLYVVLTHNTQSAFLHGHNLRLLRCAE